MGNGIHTILLKAVSHCNLACRYCSAHAPSASPELLDASFAVRTFKELCNAGVLKQNVRLLWHGGEPTLYPAEMAQSLIESMQSLASTFGISLCISIQTNGFQVSEAWHRLIVAYRMAVGLSIDGPADMHDAMRCTGNGSSSYEAVQRTLKCLHADGVDVALLSVIDDRHFGKAREYCDWLKSIRLPIRLNPRFGLTGTNNWQGYYNFLQQVFEILLKDEYTQPVAPLDDFIVALLQQRAPDECSYCGHCGTRILCLAPGNRISPCGRLVDNAFMEHSLIIGEGEAFTALARLSEGIASCHQKQMEQSQCNDCPARLYCNGFCPAVRKMDDTYHDFCQAFRKFIYFLQHDGLQLVRKRLLIEKAHVKTRISEAKRLVEEFKP